MIPRRRIVTLAGVGVVLAALASAGAGVAKSLSPGDTGAAASPALSSKPLSASAQQDLRRLRAADFSTRAGVFRYLRSRGWNPRRFVIQRGPRNYAGPHCPGKKWSCTKGMRVLQIGASNIAACTASPTGTATAPDDATCTIVQSGGGTATCQETKYVNATEMCSITQTSSTVDNIAKVTQTLSQVSNASTGSQSGVQNATVMQTNVSGNNGSSVTQTIVQAQGRGASLTDNLDNDADDFTPPSSVPISQSQEAHQSLSVVQNSATGSQSSTVNQSQSQRERADNAPAITQLQNTQQVANSCPVLAPGLDDPFANQCSTVQQTSTSGANSTQVTESTAQLQAASNSTGGQQVQGSLVNPASGGIDHRFAQSSAGLSTQSSNQSEWQMQRRLNTGGMTAAQHGPTRKGGGSQAGNVGNTATQTQKSEQFSTGQLAAVDTNVVTDSCASSGNCSSNQTVNFNGQVQTTSQSGSAISSFISCGATTVSPPPTTTTGVNAPTPNASTTGCTSGKL